MIDIFKDIVFAISSVIGIYLLFNCFYLLFFAIAGHFLKNEKKGIVTALKKIAILIPAYREDAVILESSYRAINHSYDGEFNVFVVADGLSEHAIEKMNGFGCTVIPVYFEKSTKGKSLLNAMNLIPADRYDIALVLDIDNIMADNFLNDLNIAFAEGHKVVQTHRTAKNLNTTFAFLDACNEEINNHIYRKGHYAVGLSPALIGSGMAFEFDYLHSLLKDIGETVGEDKEMDFKIAKDKNKIVYLNNTYVYDEKIENAKVFTQQRTRWIAAQIEFFKKYFFEGFRELFVNRNFEFFNKVLQSMLVPRMLLLGLLFVLSIAGLAFLKGTFSYYFIVLFGVLCFTLLISLPLKFYRDKRLVSAVFKIPYALWCMVIALFRIKRAKVSFMPTPHTSKSQTDQLSQK
ncbi:glycosyltransferase family 2 protein [Pedobacter foliorum]|uniref:glycosyltransferase n=1 Tax=Pedobacter foliorum TaxID=2739058 RepID=UPI001565BBC6|nr:glycosyltransferase family 2 protein [Pedobacter foliorum]NRF38210.1 glycosyltransferase family 2 protein [Pedobacter foliorum]